VPQIHPGNTHIYAQYTIRSKDRTALAKKLSDADIPSAVYYRKCLHQQSVFSAFPSAKKAYPVAEQASQEVISLPFHPYLSESEQDRIVDVITKAS